MGRNRKNGLTFFPFDVDFFQDIKIRKLIRHQGSISISVLIYLYSNIYKKNGYYIQWNKDTCFIISDYFSIDNDVVESIIKECIHLGIFNDSLYDKYKILTSEIIQKKWLKFTDFVNCKTFNQYRLLGDDVKIAKYKLSKTPIRLYNININLWKRISSEVFKRDNYTCKYCGRKGGILEVDHIIPFSKGGSNDLSNLATSCRRCNRQKKDKDINEFLKWKKEHER